MVKKKRTILSMNLIELLLKQYYENYNNLDGNIAKKNIIEKLYLLTNFN